MTGPHNASAKSIGAQGVEFFNQVMNLQPAVGETPTVSAARLNPNYKCPNCHKVYHDDQRAFWARHWKEREERCPACIEPSGANATIGKLCIALHAVCVARCCVIESTTLVARALQ